MDDDLSQYYVVEESPSCLILQKDNQMFIYKEFPLPQQIGFKSLIDQDYVTAHFEHRRTIKGDGVLSIEKVVCTHSELNEPRVGILFESYLKNFDEELQLRRGTDNYWSEEELFNTFQACLSGVKTFHENNHVHGAIGPQSIIFSQDGLVKIADHFVISEDLRRNWQPQLEFGQWPPEVIADWNSDQGWSQNYETIEADLWALGLVFLESMILQPSFEIYFASDDTSINIDSSQLAQKLQFAGTIYSSTLMGLLEILLAPDPLDRNWGIIVDYNSQLIKQDQPDSVEVIANSLSQLQKQIVQEADQVPLDDQQDMTNTTKTKLSEMLESCLQKSKDLISQNEMRKKQSNASYFTLNSKQINQQVMGHEPTESEQYGSKRNEQLEDLFEKSMQRSHQLLEKSGLSTGDRSAKNANTSGEAKENYHKEIKPKAEVKTKHIQNKSQCVEQSQLTKIDYDNNITYHGYVRGLKKVGYGTLYQKDNGEVLYQGDWQNDMFHGRGLLRNLNVAEEGDDQIDPENFSNLNQIWKHYQGEFLEGLMIGQGQITLADDSVFQGSFVSGSIEGYGMYIKDSQVLIGRWSQSQLTQLFSSTF